MSIEFSSRMRDVAPYPKAATYAYGGNLVKLASNETPWPPHPAVLDAIRARVEDLNRYPDPAGTALRARLAARYDTPPERIALGNGSCDILLGAAQALLEPGAELVYAWPSFSMYPHLSAMTGAREMDRPGALPRVIRLLVHCYADADRPAQHVYLREAVQLRQDLQGAQ